MSLRNARMEQFELEIATTESSYKENDFLNGESVELSVSSANGLERIEIEEIAPDVVSEDGKDWYKSSEITLEMDMFQTK